jgi:hypothetical protein
MEHFLLGMIVGGYIMLVLVVIRDSYRTHIAKKKKDHDETWNIW